MKLTRKQIEDLLKEEIKNAFDSLGITPKKKKKYIVIDNDFNRANYADMIGKTLDSPMSYVNVKEVDINEAEVFPAEPKTTPTTTPSTPKQRPLQIPKKWPNTMPKPMPKAMNGVKEDVMKSIERTHKALEERKRMFELINESPMDIDQSAFGEPDRTIKSGIEGHSETPFSAIELFKTKVLNKSTLEKLGEEEYNKIIATLGSTGRLNTNEIMNSVQMIMMYEDRHKSQLEHLSLLIVKQKFGLPDDVVDMIKAKLVRGGIEPPDESGSPEEEVMDELTPEQQAIVKKHIDKRIVHNALMMGAGFRAHSIFDNIKSNLDAIDERLYPLYRKLMPNVELFMWKTPVESMFGARQMWGKSEIKISPQGDTSAEAQAIMFPILLHEVAKAAVEILFAQHLVDIWEKHGEKVYNGVMKQSESYMDEHWMKLIGPQLWKYLHDAIDYVVGERNSDYSIVSFVLNKMATMEPEEFMQLMNDVLYDAPTAITKIKTIIDTLESEIEDFENQSNEPASPENIVTGQDNSAAIHSAVDAGIDALLAGIENKPATQITKSLDDMDITELNNALGDALEHEEYELAAKVRDKIRNL